MRSKYILLVVLALFFLQLNASSQGATITVTNTNDSGAGSLREAMTNATADDLINITATGTINLASALPVIDKNLSITGAGSGSLTVSGQSAHRIFFVESGTVSIEGLTIADGLAKGGDGGSSGPAGGGGLGAGGGLFVNNVASVVVKNVVFDTNQAVGGDGGTSLYYDRVYGGAGGGGLGGDGGGGSQRFGGGGGGSITNGVDATDSDGGVGGVEGGGTGASYYAGDGEDFGGGGGSYFSKLSTGGDGGFGGGGGGALHVGGNGGFGGGGGVGVFVLRGHGSQGGFGGGDGTFIYSTYTFAGGGGAGFGGAIFIRKGGTLSIGEGCSVTGGSVNAGSGGTGGVDGSADGTGLYLNNVNVGFDIAVGQSSTVSDIIAGTGSISKIGAGGLTLTGANTYTGGTTLNGGTITLGNDAALGAGTLTVTGNGSIASNDDTRSIANQISVNDTFTLTIDGANQLNLAGVISGEGALAKAGSSTFTLSGVNTYMGGTTITAGTLSVGADHSLGNIAGGLTFNGGTLLMADNFTIARAVTVEAAGGTINTNGFDVVHSGTISGTGLLLKDGTGTLTLSGSGSTLGSLQPYHGTIELNGGDLTLATDLSIRSTDTASTFLLTDGILTVGMHMSVGDGGTGLATYQQTGGEINISEDVWVTNNGAPGQMDISGGAFSARTIYLGVRGNGTLDISGDATVTLATLQYGHPGGTSGSSVVNLDGGTLVADAVVDGLGPFTSTFNFNGGTLQASQSTATWMSGIDNTNILVGNAIIDTAGYDVTIPTIIAGGADGDLIKNGTGDLTLSGNNTFSGDITINAGTLTANYYQSLSSPTSSAIGNPSVARDITINSGATLQLNQTDTLGNADANPAVRFVINDGTLANSAIGFQNFGAFNPLGDIVLNGGTIHAVRGYSNPTFWGAFFLKGTVTSEASALSSAITSNGAAGAYYHLNSNITFNIADGTATNDLVFSGNISNPNVGWGGGGVAGSIIKTGDGTMLLSGTNLYSGGTTINAGTISVAGGAALLDTSAVTVNNAGTFQLDDSETIGALTLSDGAKVSGPGKTLSVSGGATLDTTGMSNANLAFTGSSDVAISNGIYTGDLILGSSGTQTVNDGTFNGNFTTSAAATINAGTFGDESTDQFNVNANTEVTGGTFNGAIAIAQTLTVNNVDPSNIMLFGDTSGAGMLTKSGSGTLTLQGTIGHTNTTINAGILAVESDFSSANLTFNGGTLQVNDGTTTWDAGGNFGAGRTLTVDGGKLDITQNFDRTGTPTGTLDFTSGTVKISAGTADWNVTPLDGQTITVDGGTWNTSTIAASNTGVTNLQSGTIHVTGDADFTNGTFTFASGTLTVDGTLTGIDWIGKDSPQTVNIAGNASSSNYIVDAQGTLNVLDTGTLTVSGGLTATNNGIVNIAGRASAGGLAIGPGSAIVLDGSEAVLELTGNVDFSDLGGGNFAHAQGAIHVTGGTTTWNTGSAGLASGGKELTLGGGTLEIITADFDSRNDAFTATGGSFAVGNGRILTGTTFSLNNLNIDSDGTVLLAQGTDGTYAGVVSGSGSLTKSGTGALTLSGANTHLGGTTVTGGKLVVNGSILGNLVVNDGATLGGSGSVHNAQVTGTITPGNSIGTLTVTGNYTHDASGIYEVEINDAGQSDLIDVTGAATLTGGTVNVTSEAGTYSSGMTFTILEAAGGVTGTFTSVVDDMPFLNASLNYTSNMVQLLLQQSGSDYLSQAHTFNQRAVASYLDDHSTGASGDFLTVLNALDGCSGAGARSAFDSMGGDLYGSLSTVGIENHEHFLRTIALRLRPQTLGRNPGQGYVQSSQVSSDELLVRGQSLQGLRSRFASKSRSFDAWFEGYGIGASIANDGNASGLNYSVGGTMVGLEKRLNCCTKIGFIGGYSYTGVTLDARAESGMINSGQFATYLQRTRGRSYLTGIAGYGHNSYDTRRQVVVGNLARTAEADYGGNEFSFYLETGRNYGAHFANFQPYAALQYIQLHQDSFTESGANSIDLNVGGVQADSLRSLLGARLAGNFKTRRGQTFLLEGHGLWRHEFLDEARVLDAGFTSQTGGGFVIDGINVDRDAAILGTGLSFRLNKNMKLFGNYDLLFSQNYTAHSGSGGLQWTW